LQEVDRDQEAIERVKPADKWNEERRAVLEIYAPMYLQIITEEIKNNFLAAEGTQERLDDAAQNRPANTILAELWNLRSTKERAEFVANQIELEETAVGIPGYRAFNVYLDWHRNIISD
jgi:hypothetical protein